MLDMLPNLCYPTLRLRSLGTNVRSLVSTLVRTLGRLTLGALVVFMVLTYVTLTPVRFAARYAAHAKDRRTT